MGNPTDRHPHHRNRELVQLVGEDYFMLLEGFPRRGVQIDIGERVYVGPEGEINGRIYRRDKISRIDAEIEYNDLTTVARDMLPQILEVIVRKNERVFVEFFNIADAITIRMHSLELLPGIGKKTLMRILEAREQKPFESFEDIQERAKIDPVKVIIERIVSELQGNERYYIFAYPPKQAQMAGAMYLGYLDKIYARLGRPSLWEENRK
ncbi:MAG TPA: DUF655 domain-containing protein [Pyrodictiaceae archaeon]|nr:DUF655 domain-containing protein [Pyrodictiaceae archaeon]HIQ10967.1 DUF655 domain-containing protein [Pyrodictium sp.]